MMKPIQAETIKQLRSLENNITTDTCINNQKLGWTLDLAKELENADEFTQSA